VELDAPRPQLKLGNRVEVTWEQPGRVRTLRGSVIRMADDLIVVACRTPEGENHVYWRGDATPHIVLRRVTGRGR
jgi:hypothetical protein